MKRIPLKVWIALIFLLLFTGLSIAATVLFRDMVRDQLVIPLLDTFHFLRQLARAIDTDFVWAVFILMIYIWMLLSLPSLRRPRPRSGVYSDKRSRKGRLRHWLHEVHELQSGKYLTRYATLELKKLILNTIAFHQQCSLRQAEQWLAAPENQRHIPAEVQLLLRAEPPGTAQKNSFWQNLKILLLGYPRMPQEAPTNIDLEPILRFLEAQNGKISQFNKPGQ